MATPNIAGQCAPLLDNHRQYAEAAGYEYIVYPDRHPDFADVHHVYSRLGYLLDAFNDGAEKVVWADADIAFMDHRWDIGSLLDAGGVDVAKAVGSTPVIYQTDGYWMAGYDQQNWPGAYLCFGLLVLRNNWLSRAFLTEVATAMRADPEIDNAREQYYGQVALIKTAFAGVRLCKANEIGCFAPEIWHDGVIWKPSMPTVHLAGPATWERRAEIFSKIYLSQVRR